MYPLDAFHLEIRTDPNKGNGLFVLKDINTGDVVWREDPLVSCQFPWNKDAGYRACQHCLRPLESSQENARSLTRDGSVVLPFACEPVSTVYCQCQAAYCSAECRETADALYHRPLCAEPGSPNAIQINKLIKIWKEMHYPPEEATIMLIIRIYSYIHQAEDKQKAIADFTHFISDAGNPEIVNKLLGRFKDQIDELRTSVIQCVQHLHLDVPEEFLSPAGFLTALSVLALNGQGIGTSALSAWYNSYSETLDEAAKQALDDFIDALYASIDDTVGLDFMNNEGIGLYRIQSKVNHSCEPNVELTFPENNHKLVLKALVDIPAGTEVTFSYLDACELQRSRHSRQKLLKEKHLFTCLCSKCEREADAPDETSEDETDDDEDVSM